MVRGQMHPLDRGTSGSRETALHVETTNTLFYSGVIQQLVTSGPLYQLEEFSFATSYAEVLVMWVEGKIKGAGGASFSYSLDCRTCLFFSISRYEIHRQICR